ncbi:pyridine nucleotide-disulfide oxidoreductase [Marmoricola endophyticus]|uniref:Pyridine nucleotide-disulfide oxidoreductase n=1 Tax=Marmoricola endophyticus TaxID=2040280 RepID=A0A917BCQ9_9ACTN|nr:NAD(P)/FAD-dependent oxidoreductase [Marmoricola endophyticus]GGF35893.1 pyridine nucleotide-disulfide oxidoreductase [Marmoricola endophyticus]
MVGIDERLVGGECPYFGCIPSKMILRAADALAEARKVSGLAGSAEVSPDWAPVAARIRDEATSDWDDAAAVERIEQAGVRFVRGHARLSGERTVEVDGQRFVASRGVVLDPGTRPAAPPVDGLEGTPYWTNREVLQVETLPASLIVVGGGPIGAELAQGLARFGVEVAVVEGADHLLGNDEPEAGELLGTVLAEEGIQVLTGEHVTSVSYADGTFTVDVAGTVLTADKLLVAAGRTPNLDDLGLETVGLDPTVRTLDVDEHMRVQGPDGPVAGLWAIGDVVGHGAFTHVSMYQSPIAAADVRGVADAPVADYRALPHVTFTDPEVGAVGMTEQQARDAGLRVRVGQQDVAANTRGWIAQARGLVKVVEDADRGVLVGATVVAPAGGEVLGLLTTAVHAEVPTRTLLGQIYAFPTLHRAVLEALQDLS